jgi:hypothetical protein
VHHRRQSEYGGDLVLKPVIYAMLMSAFFVPARAQDPKLALPPQAEPKKADPQNEKVCENITPVGSRLATKRFCGTRAQWADRKRQDREALDAAQRGPCVISTTGATGRSAC